MRVRNGVVVSIIVAAAPRRGRNRERFDAMSLIYRIYQVQIVLGYVTHKSLRQQCTKRLVAQGRTIPFDREVNSSAIRSDFFGWVCLGGGGGVPGGE